MEVSCVLEQLRSWGSPIDRTKVLENIEIPRLSRFPHVTRALNVRPP